MPNLEIIGGSKKDGIVKKEIVQQNWGIALVNIPQAWQLTQGEGIRICVLDTGVDYTHPDLAHGQFKYGFDITTTPHGREVMDHDGHGSHVCGIICANGQVSGVAPLADLYVCKILGDNGNGATEWIVDAVKYAMRNNVDIISMSLGTHSEPEPEVKEILRQAISAGICIVVAAGNEGQIYQGDSVGWPAKYVSDIPEIIVVTAIDQREQHPAWSSKGEETTIAAPGAEIYSTYLNHQYRMLSGTSMATPFVTGVIALMLAKNRKDLSLSKGNLNPHEVKKLISDHAAHHGGVLGKTNEYGFGIIDISSIQAAEVKEYK